MFVFHCFRNQCSSVLINQSERSLPALMTAHQVSNNNVFFIICLIIQKTEWIKIQKKIIIIIQIIHCIKLIFFPFLSFFLLNHSSFSFFLFFERKYKVFLVCVCVCVYVGYWVNNNNNNNNNTISISITIQTIYST